ncbi:hypothetical protein HMPREF9123_2208 [Neisseria bacilliformis ATCC BAA-1200]|uniref:Uncharacterized protein n=1 Tax=Neisseria bacilliformis ATCC BAA-1200 TaxID=888742 RepID=F2BEQ1_9NEIS|nr:hypothetical protein [Neisseria bacilliformis]EGF09956.1 hypothetical protein HMPREF9123_2208 [Neisseria bacilliformis ATCC BAA-1200]QMT46872.1 hypothetical protein H3L91_07960 [Neisseria bacilliformis]
MQTAAQTRPAAARETLRRLCLLADGNGCRPAALPESLPPDCGTLAAEAMLPQIRTAAMMIAAARHDFSCASPAAFAEEADWLAARILLLRVRTVRAGIGLRAVLETANRRAAAFAAEHRLPFTPAALAPEARPRRDGLLVLDCALPCDGTDCGLIENGRRLAALLPRF